MSFSPVQVFSTNIAAAGTTATFDLGGRAFQHVNLVIPSMVSPGNITIFAAATGTTFYEMRSRSASTSTVQLNTFVIAAAGNGAIVPMTQGFQYYRLFIDSAPAAATNFKIICS